MIANHIHDALAQVRELQRRILERQRFRGYSGNARIFAGTLAFAAAIVLSAERFPATFHAHLLGWGIVLLLSVLVNYGSLLYWFLSTAGLQGDVRILRPTIDAFPPFLVGGGLTLVMLLDGHYEYLFGIWMCLFGLGNIASRHVLPRKMSWVGCFYIVSGILYLLSPTRSFLNPWPMGIVFCVGEWVGGVLLVLDKDPTMVRSSLHSLPLLEKDSYGQES
jgi:hypothetical protein